MKKPVRAVLGAVTALLSVAVLTACGAEEPTMTEATYLRVTEGLYAGFDSDESRIRLGQAICSALDDGTSLRGVAETMFEYMDGDTAALYVGPAIQTYCPAHWEKVEDATAAIE
ncbi:DUF732 domain-containing protein [Rhodococcus sp. NPDC049939]|uniref:DUF732 domain-containing protein n=1 Tax=Rhodococcus sp. NPDC049939 TaxID=3155511 RepID=UPI0033C3A431